MQTKLRKVQVGYIGVDAGLVWVGDPCYILHRAKRDLDSALGKSWIEFVDKIQPASPGPVLKEVGRGIACVVSSGAGDGNYPVFAFLTEANEVHRLVVEFDGEEADDGT